MTERHTTVGEHVFETNGRILTDLGWRAAAGQMPKDTLLIPIKDKETVAVKALEIEAKKTTPPPRYNEATLLSAMEARQIGGRRRITGSHACSRFGHTGNARLHH